MTSAQKVIKYLAIAFACFLVVAIMTGILSGLYALSGVLGLRGDDDKMLSSEMTITNFESAEIDTLDIEIAYSELTIKKADSLRVETNNNNIKFSQENKELRIKEKKHKWFSINERQELIVYIPEDLELEKVRIVTGAGKINIDNLKTERLAFELGAGEAEIKSLNVTKDCKIEGGAGKLTIVSGNINDLNLDMGVGETNLNTILTGKSEINAGVGNLNINLQNSKENYRIKTDKGIGNIRIDGKEISSGEVYGNGSNFIDVDGGIGNIEIDFE